MYRFDWRHLPDKRWRWYIGEKDAAKWRSGIGARAGCAGAAGGAGAGVERAGWRHVTSEAGPGATVCRSPATRPHDPQPRRRPREPAALPRRTRRTRRTDTRTRYLPTHSTDSTPHNRLPVARMTRQTANNLLIFMLALRKWLANICMLACNMDINKSG